MWKLVWNPTVDLRTIWQYDSPTCSTMVATIVPLIYLPFCSMILPETSMAAASVISLPSAESCRLQRRGRARRSAGGRVPCFNGGNCTETCRRCRQMGAIMALWLATLKKKNMFFQGMDGMAYIVLWCTKTNRAFWKGVGIGTLRCRTTFCCGKALAGKISVHFKYDRSFENWEKLGAWHLQDFTST